MKQRPAFEKSSAPPGKGGDPAARSWKPSSDWPSLLAGFSPAETLGRIMEDDPLRLRLLIGHRIRAAALFVDADRVHLRALAGIAHLAHVERPREVRAWIKSRVDEAIDDVVHAERQAARGELGPGDSGAPFRSLARPLGLDPQALRCACSALNDRPFAERIAFIALVVEGRQLEEAAQACAGTALDVAARARRALDAMLGCVASSKGGPPGDGPAPLMQRGMLP